MRNNADADLEDVKEQPSGVEEDEINILQMAFIVEAGMAILAIVIAYFGFYDHSQPLREIANGTWNLALFWGLLGTIPMLLYLIVLEKVPMKLFAPMGEFVNTHMVPLFKPLPVYHIVIISLLAGFCEEILFRWCFQGGLTSFVGGQTGWLVGLLVASIVFGLCHWINASYALSTTLLGLYLGALMIWTGTWLTPAIAHATFDFVALMYIRSKPLPAPVS